MQSISPEYKIWLGELKLKIRSVQLKAAVAVNSALIGFYWELGKMISEKDRVWGSRFLEQVSQDLKTEFPEMQGFSVTNLKYCKLFYNYFSIRPQPGDELKSMKSPQLGDESGREKATDIPPLDLVTKMPWGHIKELISKVKDIKEAQFYIEQTIAGHWSRDVLALQIKSGLYQRQGKAINNFKETLPDPMSDLAQQTLKDPYVFDL